MATLTKEELKNALIVHGVTTPAASAKKEEFVALYEEHIAPIANTRGEFSSDDDIDEEVTISPQKRVTASKTASKSSRKSASSKKASRSSVILEAASPDTNQEIVSGQDVVEDGLDVGAMDDDELFSMLKQHGMDAGPIVDSTRHVYKKKLAALLEEDGEATDDQPPINGAAIEFSDTEPESADDTNEEVVEVEQNGTNDSKSEDDQPAGVSSIVESPKRTTRSSNTSLVSGTPSRSSVKISGSSAKISGSSAKISGSPGRSGLRNRFGMDQPDASSSSLLRNTPTPRRSIHSYKVTETTTHLVTRNRDGLETRDSTHVVEKEENTGIDDVSTTARVWTWIKAFLRRLFHLVLLGVILLVVYYVYINYIKTAGVVEKVQDAIQEAATKAMGTGAEEKREPVPEQPAVADV